MANNTLTQEIIDRWPSKRALAADVTSKTGKKLDVIAVFRWHSRNSIPSKYDLALIEAATERSISLSLVELMKARSAHTDQVGNCDGGFQGAADGKVGEVQR